MKRTNKARKKYLSELPKREITGGCGKMNENDIKMLWKARSGWAQNTVDSGT